MKKLIVILVVALFPMLGHARGDGRNLSQEKLIGLVKDFSQYDGFDIVKVGSLGTSALKSVIRLSALAEADEDARDLLKMIDGIKKIAVVDFEDCDDKVRDRFCEKVDKVLGSSDLLMEVKDEGEKMFIYGVVNEDASKIKDFVMYAPSDCALICLFGSISTDVIAKLAND